MRLRWAAWVLLAGFVGALLGRVPIVLLDIPPRFQSAAGAVVFLAVSALMLEREILVDGIRTRALQVLAGTLVAWCLLRALGLYDESLPAALYVGTFIAAASEEVVFRGWLPETLRKRLGDGRQAMMSAVVPALSFALAHLLVQQRYSFERTGRILVLLFVAAILYSEIVRVAGLGLAVLVHSFLNALALEFGATAHRAPWYLLGSLVLGTVIVSRLQRRAAPLAGVYCATLTATLAAITGNLQRAPLLAVIALCWAMARMIPIPAAWRLGLPSFPSPSRGTAPPAGRR